MRFVAMDHAGNVDEPFDISPAAHLRNANFFTGQSNGLWLFANGYVHACE